MPRLMVKLMRRIAAPAEDSGAAVRASAFQAARTPGRFARCQDMSDKPHPDPGGTYGTADPADPARRDRWRKETHHGPALDPALTHRPDEGHERVPDAVIPEALDEG